MKFIRCTVQLKSSGDAFTEREKFVSLADDLEALIRDWAARQGLEMSGEVDPVERDTPPRTGFTLTAPNGQRVAFSSSLGVRELRGSLPHAAGQAMLSPDLLDRLAVGAQWGHVEAEGWTVEQGGEEKA